MRAIHIYIYIYKDADTVKASGSSVAKYMFPHPDTPMLIGTGNAPSALEKSLESQVAQTVTHKHYRASTAPESDLHKPLSCCFHSVHYRASTAPESNTPQATLMLLSLRDNENYRDTE